MALSVVVNAQCTNARASVSPYVGTNLREFCSRQFLFRQRNPVLVLFVLILETCLVDLAEWRLCNDG